MLTAVSAIATLLLLSRNCDPIGLTVRSPAMLVLHSLQGETCAVRDAQSACIIAQADVAVTACAWHPPTWHSAPSCLRQWQQSDELRGSCLRASCRCVENSTTSGITDQLNVARRRPVKHYKYLLCGVLASNTSRCR